MRLWLKDGRELKYILTHRSFEKVSEMKEEDWEEEDEKEKL